MIDCETDDEELVGQLIAGGHGHLLNAEAFKSHATTSNQTEFVKVLGKKKITVDKMKATNIAAKSSTKTLGQLKTNRNVEKPKTERRPRSGSAPLPLANPFQPLAESTTVEMKDVEDKSNDESGSDDAKTVGKSNKKKHIPSLTFTGEVPVAFEKTCRDKGMQFNIKRLGAYVHIMPFSDNDRVGIIEQAKISSLHFFSYNAERRSALQLICKGVPNEISVDKLTSILTLAEVTPIDVCKIPTKNGNAIFAVDYDRSLFSLEIVKERVRAIEFNLVRWEYTKKPTKGPIQCKNCTMFGHSQAHCYRPTICYMCTGGHSPKQCPNLAIEDETKQVNQCSNCMANKLDHKHWANHPMCPSRLLYTEMLEAKKKKASKRPLNINSNSTTAWPSLPPPKRTNVNVKLGTSSPPPLMPINDTRRRLNPWNYVHRQQSTPQASTSTASNEELFSIDELTNIMVGAIDDISKCRTKADQLKVIANLIKLAI